MIINIETIAGPDITIRAGIVSYGKNHGPWR